MTIPQLINEQTALIAAQTAPSSITKSNVTLCFTDLTTALYTRGCIYLNDTSEISSVASTDFLFIAIAAIGIFYWQSGGTPNGTTVFAAADTGTYILRLALPLNTLANVIQVAAGDGSINVNGPVTLPSVSVNMQEVLRPVLSASIISLFYNQS